MKKNVNYYVVKKGGIHTNSKTSDIVVNIADYLIKEFTKQGARLGLEKIKAKFADYNDEKQEVKIQSLPTEKEIRDACEFVATAYRNKEISISALPCLFNRNGISTVECKSLDELDIYYPIRKVIETKKTDYTKSIINMINKHSTEISLSDIENALNMLK